MKNVLASIALGCALAVSASAYAAGDMGNMDMGGSAAKQGGDAKAGMSHGEVKKVDTSAGKLTIKHGPLDNLGMDAMTMVFKVKDPAMISQVKPGDKIDFVAEEVDGALTVAKLQKK
ncbi:copper-binding protein [Paraburkholderia sp. 22099]|jgi:Cu/Ag efflux protein CusF|uniref:Cu and Ag efflux protein CusF n=1 Tax=Paraburkholderia terricola TaxID=169427 RepID=A0A1M6KYZ3_9BURK|nr:MULTISPECIES: copper-binding protein [Paraburkholderia]MDR6447749.1 Cu/Ag efflux protein CusF [Paraburkholderia terricola]MDR6491122.1 Cu/Ag efflux protein CusF [Paraburkholderia terricola]SDN80723.1 Cu and Ag efflux protein CusF [Paraburkholderia sediminicola]SHJ64119.1 Cu and Ag efflux protein CusF [Paraburkholderia terricola]